MPLCAGLGVARIDASFVIGRANDSMLSDSLAVALPRAALSLAWPSCLSIHVIALHAIFVIGRPRERRGAD
jgi:hypothetical protein